MQYNSSERYCMHYLLNSKCTEIGGGKVDGKITDKKDTDFWTQRAHLKILNPP